MYRITITVLLCLTLITCNRRSDAPGATTDYNNLQEQGVKTGGVKMITVHGKYKVWTKRFGNGSIKVLLLHGGPGCTHEYFECFESFFPQAGIEFYEYDQLGSFYSDQPTDTNLWHIPNRVEEVEEVRQALGLDHFFILGHSWGGMLAIEYALKYQQHLKGLIISNMVASIPRYEQRIADLRKQLSKEVNDTIDQFEKNGNTSNPGYMALVQREFYNRFICRLPEWPDPLQRGMNHLNMNVYGYMQGASEMVVTGKMKGWDRWNDMKNITVPVLTIGGEYDEMNPKEMEEMSKLVPHGRYNYCPNGSHFSFWDDQEHYFPPLIKFLKDVDEGKF